MGFIFDSEGNAYFRHPYYFRYGSDGIFVILKRKCLLIKMNWDIFILKIIIE